MRILYFSPISGSSFMLQWPHYHMISELRSAGHEIRYINAEDKIGRLPNAAQGSQVILDEVKEMLKSNGCDMVFTAASDKNIEKSVIHEIKRLGIPSVLMHCDDLSVPFTIKNIANCFDLVWATSRENINLLKSYGARTIMMPYAANPNVFKPVSVAEENYIGFIGSVYGARERHIGNITAGSLPIQVYGNKNQVEDHKSRLNNPLTRALKNINSMLPHTYQSLFFKTGRRIVASALKRSIVETFKRSKMRNHTDNTKSFPGPSFEEMGLYYSRMALSLGSIEYGSTYVLKQPVMCIHLREFEAPMCGAVHLVNSHPELQEYFKKDKEMLFYDSEEELLDKIKYYLDPKRDSIRKKIREAARRRSVQEHTWTKRFEKIWDTLSL